MHTHTWIVCPTSKQYYHKGIDVSQVSTYNNTDGMHNSVFTHIIVKMLGENNVLKYNSTNIYFNTNRYRHSFFFHT